MSYDNSYAAKLQKHSVIYASSLDDRHKAEILFLF